MSRVVRREIPWDEGKAVLEVRVWSARERDMHYRKYLLGGDQFVGGILGALVDPKVNASKSIQLVRTLVEDQRRRVGEEGNESGFEKVALCLESLTIAGETRTKGSDPDGWPKFLEDLDADKFDAIATAVADVVDLKPDEKKTSVTPSVTAR